ncbi:hypothetical protein KP509_06G073000 [Ceratopteris richardii]|uniref:Methyltransferase-like protein 1 n=1 Tax=Ceratopteris richardii TaxID=49495 RepID=A0A8T2UM65_CERRI|nr:hypothetical protein KP509_06G073000 [Ceratopteris richardii]
MGRGVKRSWSPNTCRRSRAEPDELERDADEWREERGFWRDYDRGRDRFLDRETDYQWDREFRHRDTFREDGDHHGRDVGDAPDRRKQHRQRDQQREKEDDAEYNYERDGWEVPRREKDKAERDYKGAEDRKDSQFDSLKCPQASGVAAIDVVDRNVGNISASIDLLRDRGFTTDGLPFITSRGDGGPVGEFHGGNGSADWVGEDKPHFAENEHQDRIHFEEENLPGIDQCFGRPSSRGSDGSTSFNLHSGRGRGPKGSPGQRARGGSDGRHPFAGNQAPGMGVRGAQQIGKGGRGRGGGKGARSGSRDTQKGGGSPPPLIGPGPVPGSGMVPHFGGHMGPPGSMRVIGSGIGHGPGPGLGPGGFPLHPFGAPVAWGGGRGAGDMVMHSIPPGPAPGHGAGSAPRFGPTMGPGPAHNMFFTASRGNASNILPAPSYNGASFMARGLMPEKAFMNHMLPKVNAPPGLAPSRGEQNDYSQHFVDTGLRPQNFIRDVELSDRFEEYPKLKELITRKDKLITDHACPPMYMQMDLRVTELNSEMFGTKFDVILVDPPWEEYIRRSPGVGDSMEWWSFEEIQNLRIEAIADTPSFIFLWVGDAEGLDQGRLCLKKWGFRRCEDICWVKTNKENPTPALRHDAHTLLQHSKEHCLMGIKGTVRRSSDAHIIHANIDTDIIISEEPPYGSTAKPEELYHIVEHFALGQRRLELFGEDHNIRAGWITVGKNLTSSNFNSQVISFLLLFPLYFIFLLIIKTVPSPF